MSTSPWSPRRSATPARRWTPTSRGEDLTIAFNPTYLIDGVEAVAGDEVLLETVDATKPATVRAAEETDFRYLLMPVRVS